MYHKDRRKKRGLDKRIYTWGEGATRAIFARILCGFMWFRRQKTDEKRVSDLEDRLTKAERALSKLEWEWNDVYDKLRRTMGRVVKAAQRERAAQEEGEDALNPPETVPLPHGMSRTQAEAQAKILARRNRAGGGNGLLQG